MAEDGDTKQMPKRSPQEIFERAPEAQAQQKYPIHSTGIISLPPGSRGPRSLYLRRHGDSFGFTLRHFIVYPPDSLQADGRHVAVGALLSPMDTIFVKNVAPCSSAEQAGLQHGDRIVAVNGISVTDKSYAQVVHLIQNSPEYLHLLVVPKEEDILQKFFAETAHNPISNQSLKQEAFAQLRRQQRPLAFPSQTSQPGKFYVDSASWRALQDAAIYGVKSQKQQSSIDSLYRSTPPNNDYRKPKAQPQTPHRNMGRRASEGSMLSNKDLSFYNAYDGSNVAGEMVVGTNVKTASSASENMHTYGFASLDAERRDSSSSLTSSVADGSKDSSSMYDSASTVTGQDTDDSVIMTRLRKNIQKKEEFLRRPSHTIEVPLIPREFYGKPKKFEKPAWPPAEMAEQEALVRASKPLHQNVQRVKSDEVEQKVPLGGDVPTGGAVTNIYYQKTASSPKDWNVRIDGAGFKEASPAPDMSNVAQMNGAALDDDRRLYLTNWQVVSKRAKQFESGRPLPEDDPMLNDRTSFYRSELARITSKRVEPHVTTRAHEYETRSTDSRYRNQYRDNRSLDSSDVLEEYDKAPPVRNRSNSTDSYMALQEGLERRNKNKTQPSLDVKHRQERINCTQNASPLHAAPLIPQTVEHLQDACKAKETPKVAPKAPPARPTVLNLSTKPNHGFNQVLSEESSSPVNSEERRPVVLRRIKTSNLSDDDRVTRRESYIKATGNGRMQVDDFSDEEISSQALRRGSTSGGSSGSVSLDREKVSLPSSPKDGQIIREGLLYCKIAEIDGKRATDRSWRQTWVVVKGSRLYLHKDKYHQSPSDAVELSLADGVDISTSCVRIAEDYTKRKHVLRISSLFPCRSELLLQAESPAELAEWVKTLQEQVAHSTDTEPRIDGVVSSKQLAVPQATPAVTSVEARLSPQPNKSKLPSLRNRSPTGQSPVSKTRKPSQFNEGLSSPKSKTWRGRMAKQFRKIQGATSPSSPTAPEGSTFGVSLEQCYPSNYNESVPRLVEVCTGIVEGKGLDTVGVYRVPGNSAAITTLTNCINQSYDGIPQLDSQWNDVHVVSSLLKSFFRKLPDALLTSGLYSSFIEADKIENPVLRMEEIRRLVRCLPQHHYHTLKHLMLHLKKVTDNCDVNKMEGRNLAIVFGPTLIRAVQDDMATLVNDMTHNYKIVESLICHADWFFCEDNSVPLNLPPPTMTAVDSVNNEVEVTGNRALLLDNITKVEGLKGEKVHGRELFSSIISAAHRKIRKGNKSNSSTKEETSSIVTPAMTNSVKQEVVEEKLSDIPTTVVDIEKSVKQVERGPWFNYSDQEQFRKRVENFIQETQANLTRNRKTVQLSSESLENRISGSLSGSEGSTMGVASDKNRANKTYSASNTFSNRNSESAFNYASADFTDGQQLNSKLNQNAPYNQQRLPSLNSNHNFSVSLSNKPQQSQFLAGGVDNKVQVSRTLKGSDKVTLRRGSSAENVNCVLDLNANGNLKKIKVGNENSGTQRMGSLDSLNKLYEGEDGGDLQASIMKIFDEKKKTLNPLPERAPPSTAPTEEASEDTADEPDPNASASEVYRDPSLHKSLLNQSAKALEDALNAKERKKIQEEKDKDCSEEKNVYNVYVTSTKLRRSESLNKREHVPTSNKLKRSESLNKNDNLKRSDSLTKSEKTECNNNKRRELSGSIRRTAKEFTKLKRKNGMPERSIKRRHTVGGTKDFDKVNWLDNKYEEENSNSEKTNKEKSSLRTSSPDLSSTRRERLFFEINVVGPSNVVVALRQNVLGTRPQSLPEPRIFSVPLESHV